MQFDVITLFPELIKAYTNASILKRAQEADLIAVNTHNPRDFATGKHRITDEPPFGGGGGMVLKPQPIFDATQAALQAGSGDGSKPPIILLSPQGRPFTQRVAEELVAHSHLIFICGRYEGFDERIRTHLATDEISLGDYVLTGGELGALTIVDAVTRLIPGALGAENGAAQDSHSTGLLEGAHYTKPVEYNGWQVPDILRAGNTVAVERWRREQALLRTWQRRPDLLLTADLSRKDKRFLVKLALQQVEQD